MKSSSPSRSTSRNSSEFELIRDPGMELGEPAVVQVPEGEKIQSGDTDELKLTKLQVSALLQRIAELEDHVTRLTSMVEVREVKETILVSARAMGLPDEPRDDQEPGSSRIVSNQDENYGDNSDWTDDHDWDTRNGPNVQNPEFGRRSEVDKFGRDDRGKYSKSQNYQRYENNSGPSTSNARYHRCYSSYRFNPHLDVDRHELEYPIRASSPGRRSPLSRYRSSKRDQRGHNEYQAPNRSPPRYRNRSSSPTNREIQSGHQSRRDSPQNGNRDRSPPNRNSSFNSWDSSPSARGNGNAHRSTTPSNRENQVGRFGRGFQGHPRVPELNGFHRSQSPPRRDFRRCSPSISKEGNGGRRLRRQFHGNGGRPRSRTPIRYLVTDSFEDSGCEHKCVFCGAWHFHDRCPVVIDPMERRAHLRQHGRCIVCLRENCTSFHALLQCRYCDGRFADVVHHSSVCTRPQARLSLYW